MKKSLKEAAKAIAEVGSYAIDVICRADNWEKCDKNELNAQLYVMEQSGITPKLLIQTKVGAMPPTTEFMVPFPFDVLFETPQEFVDHFKDAYSEALESEGEQGEELTTEEIAEQMAEALAYNISFICNADEWADIDLSPAIIKELERIADYDPQKGSFLKESILISQKQQRFSATPQILRRVDLGQHFKSPKEFAKALKAAFTENFVKFFSEE